MEFNPDGSLKIGGTEKAAEKRASIRLAPIRTGGTLMTIELIDTSVPYNLIEGQFHTVNSKYEIECDARLAKKSETQFEIVVTGDEHTAWVDKFCFELKDFLDDKVDIQRTASQ